MSAAQTHWPSAPAVVSTGAALPSLGHGGYTPPSVQSPVLGGHTSVASPPGSPTLTLVRGSRWHGTL